MSSGSVVLWEPLSGLINGRHGIGGMLWCFCTCPATIEFLLKRFQKKLKMWGHPGKHVHFSDFAFPFGSSVSILRGLFFFLIWKVLSILTCIILPGRISFLYFVRDLSPPSCYEFIKYLGKGTQHCKGFHLELCSPQARPSFSRRKNRCAMQLANKINFVSGRP